MVEQINDFVVIIVDIQNDSVVPQRRFKTDIEVFLCLPLDVRIRFGVGSRYHQSTIRSGIAERHRDKRQRIIVDTARIAIAHAQRKEVNEIGFNEFLLIDIPSCRHIPQGSELVLIANDVGPIVSCRSIEHVAVSKRIGSVGEER